MTPTATPNKVAIQTPNTLQQEAAEIALVNQLLNSMAQADFTMLLNATNLAASGPGTGTSVPTAALDIVQGAEAAYRVTLTPTNGFNKDVKITCFLWTGTSMPAMPYPPPAGIKIATPVTIPAGKNEGLIYITVDKSVPITSFSGLVVATAAGATNSKIEWFTLNVRPVM